MCCRLLKRNAKDNRLDQAAISSVLKVRRQKNVTFFCSQKGHCKLVTGEPPHDECTQNGFFA